MYMCTLLINMLGKVYAQVTGADPGSLEWGCLDKRMRAKRAKILGPRPQLGVAVLFK